MPIEVKILGTGSATPVYNRHPSAQLLTFNNHHYLIDCGEGTQYQLMRFRISHTRISHIFISHLHGDHYLGLIGLICTMQLWGRQKELYIFGPKGLAEILTTQLKYSESVINYDIHFREIDTLSHNLICEEDDLEIYSIPLKHRINCAGFLFKEKPKKRRLIKIRLPDSVTPLQRIALKEGRDIEDETGNVLKNEDLTLPPKKSLSYAYCSDTCYNEDMLPIIKDTDLLYHEATFHSSLKERAAETFHTTSEEAAIIAHKANVGQLLMGHFSSRYRDLDILLAEAKGIFPQTLLAEEGKSYFVKD